MRARPGLFVIALLGLAQAVGLTACRSAFGPHPDVPTDQSPAPSGAGDAPARKPIQPPADRAGWIVFDRGVVFKEVVHRITASKHGDIYRVDPAQPMKVKALAPEPRAADLMPAWSPDKSRIVFASNRGRIGTGDSPVLDLWSMNADGGDLKRLTSEDAHDWTPAWSPDGQHIAFASTRGHRDVDNVWKLDVWIMKADGSDPRPIYRGRSQDEDPVFSRDGRTLYFMVDASEDGCFFQIWQADVATGEASAKVVKDKAGAKLCGEDPSVSPDGRFLYFFQKGQLGRFDLVARTQTLLRGTDEPWIGPTGQRYVFMRDRNLWTAEVDTGGAEKQVTEGGQDYFPRWTF